MNTGNVNTSSQLQRSESTKTSKNGYEIRTDILAQAKDILHFEYNAKLEYWEGNKTTARPAIPSLEDIITAAGVLYNFVNSNSQKR